jgi:hypothetical protein
VGPGRGRAAAERSRSGAALGWPHGVGGRAPGRAALPRWLGSRVGGGRGDAGAVGARQPAAPRGRHHRPGHAPGPDYLIPAHAATAAGLAPPRALPPRPGRARGRRLAVWPAAVGRARLPAGERRTRLGRLGSVGGCRDPAALAPRPLCLDRLLVGRVPGGGAGGGMTSPRGPVARSRFSGPGHAGHGGAGGQSAPPQRATPPAPGSGPRASPQLRGPPAAPRAPGPPAVAALAPPVGAPAPGAGRRAARAGARPRTDASRRALPTDGGRGTPAVPGPAGGSPTERARRPAPARESRRRSRRRARPRRAARPGGGGCSRPAARPDGLPALRPAAAPRGAPGAPGGAPAPHPRPHPGERGRHGSGTPRALPRRRRLRRAAAGRRPVDRARPRAQAGSRSPLAPGRSVQLGRDRLEGSSTSTSRSSLDILAQRLGFVHSTGSFSPVRPEPSRTDEIAGGVR